MANDSFEILIFDEQGEVLLRDNVGREAAEQAIADFGLVEDKPHMTLARALIAPGRYRVGNKVIMARRVSLDTDANQRCRTVPFDRDDYPQFDASHVLRAV